MQYESRELKTYPPKVVGSVSTFEDWVDLSGSHVADECDWIELRLDTLPQHISARELMENTPSLPIVATARAQEEGGKRAMPNSERFAILAELLPYVHAVDIEIAYLGEVQDLVSEARKNDTLVIASGHDFDRTPCLATMVDMNKAALTQGADIVKLAFNINKPTDILTGIRFLEQVENSVAIMGMGSLGPTSRLLYSQLGSCLIYGYLGQHPAAPGQWPAGEFKRTLGLLSSTYSQLPPPF